MTTTATDPFLGVEYRQTTLGIYKKALQNIAHCIRNFSGLFMGIYVGANLIFVIENCCQLLLCNSSSTDYRYTSKKASLCPFLSFCSRRKIENSLSPFQFYSTHK
jgi:hypothetical protein